ncbi:MAG: response regulator [Defluviitaleaceae bacterium]|nr:response regulator [Defluviitaleaceae bacterium]MCL2262442.1 response regulator [Defluviitaleaceae bacterium]
MDESKKNSILIVDDERSNITVLRNILGSLYTIYASVDGEDALETADEFVPDIILLDIIMPEMDGFDVLQALKKSERTKDIVVIFITGLDNPEAEERGLTLGAADFISKPFNPTIVKLRVELQTRLINNARAMAEQAQALRGRTAHLLRVQHSAANVLAGLVDKRDKITGKHIEQTSKYMEILVEAMKQDSRFKDAVADWHTDTVVMASRLHDIGKITVSDLILNKPGKFTPEEYEEMKQHAIQGENIINDVIASSGKEEIFDNAKLFAGSHHERWDGLGYPRGLAGKDIPFHGRVMAIADVYDALVSTRPYKESYSHDKACSMIIENKGTQFDPDMVDLFLTVADDFKQVTE